MTHPVTLHSVVVVALSILMTACGAAAASTDSSSTTPSAAPHSSQSTVTAANVRGYVERGIALLQERRCAEAIREGFDPAIAFYEGEANRPRRTFVHQRAFDLGALTGDAMLRALEASTSGPPRAQVAGQPDSVIEMTNADRPDAIFLRAYCLIELQQIDEAERALREALALIPDDFVYAGELDHLMHARQQWAAALELFRRAAVSSDRAMQSNEIGANAAHPDGAVILFGTVGGWKRRAMRGIGFSLRARRARPSRDRIPRGARARPT